MQKHLGTAVKGTAVEFSDALLSKMTDMARVRKVYKLYAQPQALSKKAKEQTGAVSEEAERKELEVVVLGLMALRGAN